MDIFPSALTLSDLDYELPADLIAQEPRAQRDDSRLLVYDRETRAVSHHRFHDLPSLLPRPALLAVNETRVVPARLEGQRASGGRVELLLIGTSGSAEHPTALIRPAHRLKVGERLQMDGGPIATIEARCENGSFRVTFDRPLSEVLGTGRMPLPHYIRRDARRDARDGLDAERYQTVYARNPGAVAAPTAGLHFTPELLERVRGAGVELCKITLHVGPGTFRPIRSESLAEHRMESEACAISPDAARQIARARAEGTPIVAVGTTTVRALESAARRHEGIVQAGEFATSLFIAPPFSFQVVDHLITNFHLPRSSLLALVAALAGLDEIKRVYRLAIDERYRFYSYGDAMLIR